MINKLTGAITFDNIPVEIPLTATKALLNHPAFRDLGQWKDVYHAIDGYDYQKYLLRSVSLWGEPVSASLYFKNDSLYDICLYLDPFISNPVEAKAANDRLLAAHLPVTSTDGNPDLTYVFPSGGHIVSTYMDADAVSAIVILTPLWEERHRQILQGNS